MFHSASEYQHFHNMGIFETMESSETPACTLPNSPSDSPKPHSSKSDAGSEGKSPTDPSSSDEGLNLSKTFENNNANKSENPEVEEIENRQKSEPQVERPWEPEAVEGREGERKRGFLSSTLGVTGKALAKVFTKKNRVGSRDQMNNLGTGCMSSCAAIEPSHRMVCRASSESSIPLCQNLLDSIAPMATVAGSFNSMDSVCPPEPVSEPPPLYPGILRPQFDVSDPVVLENLEISSPDSVTDSAAATNMPGPSWELDGDGAFDALKPPESSQPFIGPKYKFVTSGDVQVCKIKHEQNLLGKLASSKLLRRWETHHLYLNDMCISSKTPYGPLSTPISYWQIEDVYPVVRWDTGRKHVIHIVLPDGSLLLQTSNAYTREQWYHSIVWKRNVFKYQHLLRSSKRPEILLKGLKALVEYATTTPLHGDYIAQVPISIISNYLDIAGDLLGKTEVEEILLSLSPLLDKTHPPPALCRFFSRQCRRHPRCRLVGQLFNPVVCRALKHHMDFGKYPQMKRFIQDYIHALNHQNDGINVVRNFVRSVHGQTSACPHPRVMSNLVSVCLAAIHAIFERNNSKRASSVITETDKEIAWDEQLLSYLVVFDTISKFDDWLPSLAQLLQPIPFPKDALENKLFIRSLASVIRRIGSDERCEVHQMVLGIRDDKNSWFHRYSPSHLTCSADDFDDFELWGVMLERLISCCCRRKRFLTQLCGNLLGGCLLLALREHSGAQEALCLLLEWKLIPCPEERLQIATALQTTPSGIANYAALCDRQLHLMELQQKGGPRKLSLPSRSTDRDLAKLLLTGSLGNLECLSLAFTQVTSACAEQLIKLPSLRYLNLWSTQFGDSGLHLISEHLVNLQILNLCETPVTDNGILAVLCMQSLRKLNLNSTKLSAQVYRNIKEQLPCLEQIDVRYTEAW